MIKEQLPKGWEIEVEILFCQSLSAFGGNEQKRLQRKAPTASEEQADKCSATVLAYSHKPTLHNLCCRDANFLKVGIHLPYP
jgi:hypothetical protein